MQEPSTPDKISRNSKASMDLKRSNLDCFFIVNIVVIYFCLIKVFFALKSVVAGVPWKQQVIMTEGAQSDFGLITRPYLHTAADSFNNLIIAFCLDGTVYALDNENGAILWRTSGSFTEGPLLKKRKRSANLKVEYLIEPLGDGAIFQVEAEEIKRLPFTLKSLVQMSPVHWQETEEKSLYLIAKRESSIFVLDLRSGRVKKRQFKDSGSNSENSDEEMALEALDRASLLV